MKTVKIQVRWAAAHPGQDRRFPSVATHSRLEQGSSASQMTAAKIIDIISRLPGCDGQAADAVSAYTQVQMEDAPKLLNIPKSECSDIWIRLPRHKMAKIMVQYGRPSCSS